MNTTKAEIWNGYYHDYLIRACARGIEPAALLDEEWFDGKTTAHTCVLPHLNSESVVLEIASGIGRVGRFVASNCRKLVCTDILEEALCEAKNNLEQFDNIDFDVTNGYDLQKFSANQFDCVYSFTAFFHFDFELVVAYFAEIKRVLKPNGIAVIEFKRWKDKQDVQQLLEKIESRGGIRKYEADLDKWRYVSLELLALFCNHFNFEIVDGNLTRFTMRKTA